VARWSGRGRPPAYGSKKVAQTCLRLLKRIFQSALRPHQGSSQESGVRMKAPVYSLRGTDYHRIYRNAR
jgi:hypothetical protein